MPQQDWPALKKAPSTSCSTLYASVASGAHVSGILAAELEAGADEARGGSALHRVTAVHRAREGHEADAGVGDQPQRPSWLACSTWNTPAGSPAAANASAKRSAQSGVCDEWRRITALPARIAGTTELTAVR